MKIEKKIKKNKENKVPSIQLWYGENQSLLNIELTKWLQLFRSKYQSAQVKQFDYTDEEKSQLTIALHQAINSSSLFIQKTFIVVRDILSAEPKGELTNLIEQACSQPPQDLILLLIERKKIVWTKPLPKILKKSEEAGNLKTKEFINLAPIELERWIISRVKEQGGKIAVPAARQLAGALGNDFIALSNEISKLIAWRDGHEISTSDIDLMISRKINDDIFTFIDAVGKRDMRLAQEILTRQFSIGTSPQSLIGLLAWHVRVLALVRQSLDNTERRLTPRELAEELGLHPYVVTKALQQIPYYSAERINWFYDELSNLDVKLKTSRTDPEVLFGLFLSKLSNLKPNT